jgi:hypothetical protein
MFACACAHVCESVCMSERVQGKMEIGMSKFGFWVGIVPLYKGAIVFSEHNRAAVRQNSSQPPKTASALLFKKRYKADFARI